MIIHGRNLLLMEHTQNGDTSIVAMAKSCEINVQCEILERTSSTQQWREYLAGRKGWTTSLNYLVTLTDFVPSVLSTGNKITLRFTDRNTGALLQGDAFIKTCKVVATTGNLTTGSFSFQGTGELTQVTTT